MGAIFDYGINEDINIHKEEVLAACQVLVLLINT